MAILQKWSVSVEVDGKAVEEIEPRAGNGDQSTGTAAATDSATKYIEVKALTEFAIRIAAPKAFPLTGNAVVADIFIDGVCFGHKLFDKYNTQKGSYFLVAREKVIEGQEIGPSDGNAKLNPFQFSSLQAHSHTTTETSEEVLAKLGSIEIKLVHFRKIRWSAAKHGLERDTDKATPVSSCSLLHLRHMGLSHLVKLGPERSYKRSKPWAGERLGDVFATFTFKYSSHNALQDLGLIARSPSTEPAGEKPVEEWSVKQLRSFVRKFQAAVRRSEATLPPFDKGVEYDGESVKDESPKVEDVKSEVEGEQVSCAEIPQGVKRELPEGIIVIDLDPDGPPPKRGRGRPRKVSPPAGVEVITVDEDEDTLFI